ncbi:hypothetical protein HPP92_009620 [Vanilla planifolia]|uniref:C2H2-type domain-containing protein n=1 Tax=Vanilla planifolia TaxID=51239 RepID=A0A835R4K3_VANPL|nr:hypothetical protein HPP92_009620 [Vanilla planifolia]
MFPSSTTSLSTSISEEASASPENRFLADFSPLVSVLQPPAKKKRSPPGNPDPEAEVVALSPETLLATNRFVCELCNKGFRRDQNLQLHRRGHNLPWRLRQRSGKETAKKRVYVCPEPSCVHHHPARALGDLTGIKSTSRGSTGRRSGSVISARKNMRFFPIGRRMSRAAEAGSISVTAGLSSPERTASSPTGPSVMPWLKKVHVSSPAPTLTSRTPRLPFSPPPGIAVPA